MRFFRRTAINMVISGYKYNYINEYNYLIDQNNGMHLTDPS